MKEVLLFDSDGVLVDTEQYYFRASQEILAERNLTLTLDTFREVSLIRGSGIWDAFPELTDPLEIEAMRIARNRLFNHYLATEPITIDGVEETLAELTSKYKYRMAIVTSALREDFLTVHRRSNLLHFFDFYLTNGDYQFSKPHPDPWLTALTRFDTPPEKAVVIEDSQRGVTAGIAAGITTIAIPTDLTRGASFPPMTYICNSFRDLPELLKQL